MILKRSFWFLAVVICLMVAKPIDAGMMLLGMGPAPASPTGYTPLCGGSLPACANAYSTERQLISSATVAFQVERSVDSTTQNVGFVSSGANTGQVNTASVDSFCNASVGGTISRNCYISGLPDQAGASGCSMTNSNAAKMPNYMVNPLHGGLPQLQKPYPGDSGFTRAFILDNAGGNDDVVPSPQCLTLTGGAQSLFFSGSSRYQNFCCGNFGFQELVSQNSPQGAMFSAFVGPAGYTYDHCSTGSPCGGMDSEAQGPQYNYTANANGDFFDTITYDHTVTGGVFVGWINNVNVSASYAPDTVADSLVTKGRISWGASGDNSGNGPNISRTVTFYTSALNSTQAGNVYANETNFIASLSAGYEGPGDDAIVGNETSTSTGLSLQHVKQMQWLSQAFSLRKAWAGYEGPALNVCKGSGACEDIGWVNNIVDTATMSAYCGPISGLNNCAVQIWYNQALNQSSLLNGVNTGIDATAVSSSNRPAVLWSGCGTSAITVCIQTSSTNYFTTAGITVTGGYTMSAVAMRTGGTTALSAILSSVSTPETFIGFAAAANTCVGAATSGGGQSTVTCNDNAVHSITVDAHTSPSASTITYVDGVAGIANTSAIGYSSSGLGVGATGAGLDPCTCQLSEVLVYADASDTSFNTALGSSGVAHLRTNQRAVFGF